MIDLNAILSAALTAAVAEAVKPLLERVEELETQLKCHANFDLTRMEQRIEALEQATPETPAAISAAAFVTYLDQQEWFWNKINDYISRNMERADSAILAAVRDDENVKDTIREIAREAADAAVEEAMNDHCTTYDHDDYDRAVTAIEDADLDDIVTYSNIKDAVGEALNNATLSISV